MHRTHLDTGYPAYWPEDPAAFLASSTGLAAWLAASDDGRLIGHVAIHDAEGDPDIGPVHEFTGAPARAFAVIARLIVDPERQSRGVGKALLDVAVAHAKEIGRHAILDVVTSSSGAIAFYEAQQWQRVGSV